VSAFIATIAFQTGRSVEAAGPAKYFAIYYTTTSGSTSYVNGGGQEIAIKSGTTVALSYIPAINKTIYVGQSTSTSYSTSYFSVYTAGDSLFLITRSVISSEGDETADFGETNLATGQRSSTPQVWFFEPQTFAVVNNMLYFQSGTWYNMFTGKWSGGGLYLANLTVFGGKEKLLLNPSDPDNYGHLVSTGGNLFRYLFISAQSTVGNSILSCTNPKEGDCWLVVNQIDLATGRIMKDQLVPLPRPSSNGTFSSWALSADANAIYLAALTTPSGNSSAEQTWQWSIPLTEFENSNLTTVLGTSAAWANGEVSDWSQLVQPVRLLGIQACEGDLLLNMGGSLLLQNLSTGSFTVIPGTKPGAQLLYGATAPASVTTNTTASASTSLTTTTTPSSSSTTQSIPEFPFSLGTYQVFIILAVMVVMLSSYFIMRRNSRRRL
jgi:hypothetical protein